MTKYTGSWQGKIENAQTFSFQVAIENLGLEKAKFKISNNKNIIDHAFDSKNISSIEIHFAENYSFRGQLSENGKEIDGFIKSGLLLYHLKLIRSNQNTFIGTWNILMIDELKSLNFYLSVENGEANNYQAYPIFGDDRFTGTWCANFEKKKDSLFFEDFKTGLRFKAKLFEKEIQLGIYIGEQLITRSTLRKSKVDWVIGGFNSDVTSNTEGAIQLSEMESLILKNSLTNTHSVLVSKNNEIVYERYFNGYNANIPHDMRSASKSISSAIIGITKDKSLFQNLSQSVFDFLPRQYQVHRDSLKQLIDLRSLLTMSSGLDAIDFGIDRKSIAAEDNYQPTQDWTQTILAAPMIYAPNKKANYGSANPYLLGVAIDSIVPGPVELFIHENLFRKLKVSNYIIQTDLKGRPYFGGGMYMTSRDMIKFGELFLNEGKFNGIQILSKNWITNSFMKHQTLENAVDKNAYGYLWWHNTYSLNNMSIRTIEARGAGGQYIFIVPRCDTVAVITSGNYTNGKNQQPEYIFEECILPKIAK